MKILYLPCHVTLEYDEIKLFTELGHSVISTGVYGDPDNYIRSMRNVEAKFAHTRPSIDGYAPDPELLAELKTLNKNHFNYTEPTYDFTVDFLNKFDIIYVSYYRQVFNKFTSVLNKKLLIHNTVSQAQPVYERQLSVLKKQGIKIIRFYRAEKNIIDSVEEDAIIPQYVDENLYAGWDGNINRVLTVCRAIPSRPVHTNKALLEDLVKRLPVDLYGTANHGISCWKGELEFNELVNTYRAYRLFFNLGTKPGGMPYTCIEAMMTGCPIVSVGRILGGSFDVGVGDTCAVPEFIENGINGFYSDNVDELEEYCNILLNDYELCKEISANQRKTALIYFSKEVIKEKWKKFLQKHI